MTMSNIDFKVTFVRSEDGRVDITSTNRTIITSKINKLCQKIIHGLLTRIGDDILYPDWGCFLIDVLRKPYSVDKKPEIYPQVFEAVEKVKNDIIKLQSNDVYDEVDDASLLKDLELIDVIANEVERQWEIDIRVYSLSGEEYRFTI
jgi:phage baseplate assembly protein W